ncbi:hypothetical protein ACTWQB_16385 [Piscibacillus sp. B03]|uniref:hypothetical protein n=1 Tax=Piscibacillus sp. B03 TaxID=3457430 RepID=UPI003FCCACBA
MEETFAVPAYFTQKGVTELGFSLEEVGTAITLSAYENDNKFTFRQAVEELSTHGPEDEKLSIFEIRRIIDTLEKEGIFKIYIYKNHFNIEWLPRSEGEMNND